MPAAVVFGAVGMVMLAAGLQTFTEPQVLFEPRPAGGATWYAGILWRAGLVGWGLAALGAVAGAARRRSRQTVAQVAAVGAALTSGLLLADDALQLHDPARGPWGGSLLGAEAILFALTVAVLWWARPAAGASWLLAGTLLAAATWLALDVGGPVPHGAGPALRREAGDGDGMGGAVAPERVPRDLGPYGPPSVVSYNPRSGRDTTEHGQR